MLVIKEVEMVGSVDDLETSQTIGGRRFLDFEVPDAKIASTLKKIILHSYFKEESQFGGAKRPVGRPISPRKTGCVHDLRILPSDWST